jgi:predicted membrane protein
METPKLQGRVIIGLLLIILGALAVMHNYNIIDLSEYPITWEYFFIGAGLLFILLSSNKTAGVVLLSIGLFNLLPELWPLVIVFIGAYIIWGRGRCGRHRIYYKIHADKNEFVPENKTEQSSSNDYIESVNIFGGANKVIHSENFRGGNIVSIFGGSEINLTNCKLADGENIIDVTAIFGGNTIIVPPDWRVEVDVLPVFGGFGDKRSKDPNKSFIEGKVLKIKGFVLFGGGEVKTIF